jgi:hypothetical protein
MLGIAVIIVIVLLPQGIGGLINDLLIAFIRQREN